jgi:hypothetical protein
MWGRCCERVDGCHGSSDLRRTMATKQHLDFVRPWLVAETLEVAT